MISTKEDLIKELKKLRKTNPLIPNSPDEIVYTIGASTPKFPKKQIDEAVKIAKDIFRRIIQSKPEIKEAEEKGTNKMAETLQVITDELNETTNETLTQEQISSLPTTRFGRDEQGRPLNKDGTIRKARNDKGKKRAAYTKSQS